VREVKIDILNLKKKTTLAAQEDIESLIKSLAPLDKSSEAKTDAKNGSNLTLADNLESKN